MSTEIKPFKTDDVLEKIKDKIKATFVDLIPEDHWNMMIKRVVDDWMQPKDGGYNKVRQSDFMQTVRAELNTYAKDKIKSVLKEYEEHGWVDGKQAVNDQIKKMIIENSGDILANAIGHMVQMTVNNLRSF